MILDHSLAFPKIALTLRNLPYKQIFSAISIKTFASICNIGTLFSQDTPIVTDKSTQTPSELDGNKNGTKIKARNSISFILRKISISRFYLVATELK